MRNVWFLWNPELVRPVWIAGMSILPCLNFVSFVLLCRCFSFLSRNNVIYPAEQAYFGGDRIGMSRSHAAILDDESNRGLGIVKKKVSIERTINVGHSRQTLCGFKMTDLGSKQKLLKLPSSLRDLGNFSNF